MTSIKGQNLRTRQTSPLHLFKAI